MFESIEQVQLSPGYKANLSLRISLNPESMKESFVCVCVEWFWVGFTLIFKVCVPCLLIHHPREKTSLIHTTTSYRLDGRRGHEAKSSSKGLWLSCLGGQNPHGSPCLSQCWRQRRVRVLLFVVFLPLPLMSCLILLLVTSFFL